MLSVALDRLPADEQLRHAALRDYFCDKDAVSKRVGDHWELELAWPGDIDRHVDRRISAALTSWDGIGLSDMALARRRSGRVLTALYDTWTLLSWSEWAARARPGHDEAITILHLDDHRDLGSPRLGEVDGVLRDLISGKPFDFLDPRSVLDASESGAVGMGSFLTPFVHAFPRCDVRQLCQPPKISGTFDWHIRSATQVDDMLAPGSLRPAIALEPADGPGPGRYRATDDVGAWLADIGSGPVLLHVDMDYFNNRYDGDCDWPDRHPRHDPAIGTVLEKIDEATSALRSAGLIDRIQDAVIAFSPGFFPAELWEASEQRLRQGLAELYG